MPIECGYFNRGECRSCVALALPESERTRRKQSQFEAAARAALGAGNVVRPLWQPMRSFSSRTKAKLSVSGTLKDPVIGLVDRAFEATELLDCPLHAAPINELLRFLRGAISEYAIAPYHIGRRQGELKGFILKTNESGSEAIVRFVLRSRDALAKVKRAARELQKRFSCVQVVSANIQPLPAAVLEGEEEIFLSERKVIWESFGGTKLAFMPQSFAQVTHQTAEALYLHVRERLNRVGARSLLDLYCGVGGFSLVAAPVLSWGHGVELSSQAIECARLGCRENKIGTLEFESGDVDDFLARYPGPAPDALLFNPPRRGLSPAAIERAQALGARAIFYSSCNPETLLRDLRLFGSRYRVKELAPFDMFPLTGHLEVVAQLDLIR